MRFADLIPRNQLSEVDPKKKPTPAQLAAANAEAKRLAVSKGLMIGESAHVGDRIPNYIDARTGREITEADIEPPVGVLSNKVPMYVQSLEWDDKANLPYYIDEKTGDAQYVIKELFFSPRFKKAKPIMQNPLGNL